MYWCRLSSPKIPIPTLSHLPESQVHQSQLRAKAGDLMVEFELVLDAADAQNISRKWRRAANIISLQKYLNKPKFPEVGSIDRNAHAILWPNRHHHVFAQRCPAATLRRSVRYSLLHLRLIILTTFCGWVTFGWWKCRCASKPVATVPDTCNSDSGHIHIVIRVEIVHTGNEILVLVLLLYLIFATQMRAMANYANIVGNNNHVQQAGLLF